MGKKIGIMTWYKYKNYGSLLQAYALAYRINKLGYEPMLINYTPKKNRFNDFEYTYVALLKKVIKALQGLTVYKNEERDAAFEKFVKSYLQLSHNCTSVIELEKLNDYFDAFVCGSDQIWAPSCFDEKFFLSFVKQNRKMISYAPSIGLNDINDKNIKAQMGNLIARFEHLSIREEQGKKIIKANWGYDAEVVLDPTLLLSKEEWCQVFDLKEKKSTLAEEYVLCYFLGNPKRYKRQIEDIKNKTGLPIYVIPTFNFQKRVKNKIPFEIGPKEFVELVKNASYVCTDSFHGIAFSINFNVPFFAFERFKNSDINNQNSRIYNLLEKTELSNRIVRSNESISICSCDFSKANSNLVHERTKSIDYLKRALNSAVDCTKENTNSKKNIITNYCCGCGCCASICPTKAIRIIHNEKGFLHYYIDEEKCIHCDVCKSVCPFNEIKAEQISTQNHLYAIKSNNAQVLKKSSSGGIAFEIAQYMANRKYNICGCQYNYLIDSAEHIYIEADNNEELVKLQGSKYIQSNSLLGINHMIQTPVGTKVVFFGTPCQVAGVDKLLRRLGRREDYILIDLICHGVPTQNLWDKYLNEVVAEKKMQAHPQVLFRDKLKGWRSMTMFITDGKKKYRKNQFKDNFYTFFRLGQCYMETCYECPYRVKTSADIRIGDYWGKRFIAEKQGMSMVIAMSKMGENVLNDISEQKYINLHEYPINEYWQIQYPVNQLKPLYYEEMISDISNSDVTLSVIRKKYCARLERRDSIAKIREKINL